jgi:phage gp29-like protein
MTDQTKIAPPEVNEIATVGKDITYPAYAGVLRQQDDTLLTRGQAKGLKLYDEIERDCTVYGNLQKRKLAIISRPWQVDPASDAPLDIQAADIVRAQLESQALNFDNVCLNLLDCILKGFAVSEVIWDYDGTQIVVTEIKPRNQRRFGFGDDYQLRLKTLANLIPGEELPERKFIVHSFGSKDGTPYGLGLGTRLFWPAFFKRQGITFWMTFADKFASPTPIGEYPNGTSKPEQDNLLAALDALSQSAGVVIPQGMIVRLLEAARSGEAGYETLCHYMDEQITFATLGEAGITKGGGGQAASAAITRNEVRLELVQADADLLSATLNRTLVKWITEYNVPGAMPPRVWRKVEEQKDLGAVAARDLTICEMGFKPTLAYIIETYGGEWEVAAPPVSTTSAAKAPTGAPGDAANFKEAPSPTGGGRGVGDAPAALADQLAAQSAAAWSAVLAHITDLVDHAESMEALQTDLVNAYGGLPLADLRKVMAQGFQMATLAGMADVATGN